MNKKQIKYTDQIVFFIDILGFKNLIKENRRTVHEIIHILERFGKLLNYEENENINITQLSDSIVISFEYNQVSGLFNALYKMLHLQFELFRQERITFRGACVKGKIFHTKDFCFGEAMIEAYALENKCVIYPRIIVSEDIIEECSKYYLHSPEYEKNDIKRLLKEDTDGYWYIDYISNEVAGREMDSPEYWGLYMRTIRELIVRGLSEERISVRQKYQWLKDKYNKALKNDLIEEYRNDYNILLEKIESVAEEQKL